MKSSLSAAVKTKARARKFNVSDEEDDDDDNNDATHGDQESKEIKVVVRGGGVVAGSDGDDGSSNSAATVFLAWLASNPIQFAAFNKVMCNPVLMKKVLFTDVKLYYLPNSNDDSAAFATFCKKMSKLMDSKSEYQVEEFMTKMVHDRYRYSEMNESMKNMERMYMEFFEKKVNGLIREHADASMFDQQEIQDRLNKYERGVQWWEKFDEICG